MIYNFAGSDPGDSNYGYSVINVKPLKGFKVSILELGMMTCRINNLTDRPAKPPKSKRRKRMVVLDYAPYPVQFRLFTDEWDEIIRYHGVKRVTSERFQARGLRGKSIECVSIMNGIICSVADAQYKVYEIITPASWKNQVNRYFKLEDLYKKLSLTPHTVDSVFIGLHGAIKYFGIDWADIDFEQVIDELSQFEFVKR